ncbi:MAG: hypothetical protein IK094_03930 [Treponema sp.]|nr:hypothetical protein [Treponema sp.]
MDDSKIKECFKRLFQKFSTNIIQSGGIPIKSIMSMRYKFLQQYSLDEVNDYLKKIEKDGFVKLDSDIAVMFTEKGKNEFLDR